LEQDTWAPVDGARAHRVLQERFAAVVGPVAIALGIETPSLWICPMRKRWGSHTPSGRILLNDALIAARRDCIDYVIVHELCHVVEPNHSQQFLRLLRRFMPDWERRKELLERSTA
jgi:predicted metal-dependent hydrolase